MQTKIMRPLWIGIANGNHPKLVDCLITDIVGQHPLHHDKNDGAKCDNRPRHNRTMVAGRGISKRNHYILSYTRRGDLDVLNPHNLDLIKRKSTSPHICHHDREQHQNKQFVIVP